MMKKFLLFILLVLSGYVYAVPDPEAASTYHIKPLISGKHSMVVTNNKWATLAAQEILDKGGNAFDAAIAAGFVLGLTEPQSSGIGGGGYALTYSAKSKAMHAYDGREVAPHTANSDWFLDKNGHVLDIKKAILSAKSIGVPAEVALFYKLHQEQGQLPWKTLLQPAIRLAKNGFPMSPRLYHLLSIDSSLFENNEDVKKVFFSRNKVKPIGSIIKNAAYAATLQIIAQNPEDFYRGKLAKSIIQDINKAASTALYNEKDFSNYKVIVSTPICMDYRDKYNICSAPPSSGGGVTMQELLGIYAINAKDLHFRNPMWMYQFLEASKLAFADRNQYIADPAFVKQPVKGLLDKDYLKKA